jgi:hypothetical protein
VCLDTADVVRDDPLPPDSVTLDNAAWKNRIATYRERLWTLSRVQVPRSDAVMKNVAFQLEESVEAEVGPSFAWSWRTDIKNWDDPRQGFTPNQSLPGPICVPQKCVLR